MDLLFLEPLILRLRDHFDQEWLNAYITSYFKKKPLPLPLEKLAFQSEFIRRVNLALLDIPFGETMTYGELGQKVGCPSGQAIGQALTRNPFPLLLPCHRIVPKKGGIGGYAFGSEMKEKLLAFEGVLACNLHPSLIEVPNGKRPTKRACSP